MSAIPRPLVTVCIPTFRGEEFLGAAIESVLAQTLADFELVVIDDGSPEGTEALVRRYLDHRIVYLRNTVNLGPEGNWNRCLDQVRGRYFKLLPHDDLLHPECLERQVALLQADLDERLAFVFCAREVLHPSGRVLARRGYPGGRGGRIAAAVIKRACVRRGTNLVGEPGAVLMRASTAARAGPFDATNPYVIDLDYWFRLLAFGDAAYDPMTLAAFRVNSGSWSVAIGANQARDFKGFVAREVRVDGLEISYFDRLFGRVMPSLNNLLRLMFYRIYLR